MIEKDSVITISESDKRYAIITKEQVGDIVRVDFQFEDIFYFGKIETMSSSGTLVVKVKGIYGAGKDYEENDLV
jgi:hypothetical protein